MANSCLSLLSSWYDINQVSYLHNFEFLGPNLALTAGRRGWFKKLHLLSI